MRAGAARGVWHLIIRAMVRAAATTLIADEAVPDADRERGRRQASPRIAVSLVVSGDRAARSKEMPDTSGADAAWSPNTLRLARVLG